MRRRIIFLVSLFSLSLLGFGLNDTSVESQTDGKRPKRNAEIPNKFADVVKVSLNKESVFIACSYRDYSADGKEKCPDDDMKVEVTTVAEDADGDVLTYNYKVPGGRIVGTGAKVIWDLSGVQPGRYTITVGADDGCGACGATKTEEIIVERCDCRTSDTCEVFLPCPVFDVQTPKALFKAGDVIVFNLNLDAETNGATVKYNWTLSSGTIIEGQGTPGIKVKTTRAMAGSIVTATVEFNYPMICEECLRAGSQSVLVRKK